MALRGVGLAVGAVASLLVSCGSDPAPLSVGPPTTAISAPKTTSTERSNLFSKLPDAKAVGHGYKLQDNSSTHPPKPFDPATTTTTTATRFNSIDKFCPGANWPRLDSYPTVDGVEYVTFVDKTDRELTVGLAPVPPSLDRAGMTKLLRKINDCRTIVDDAGFAVSTDRMRADDVGDLGDYGIDIHWTNNIVAKGNDGGPSFGGLSSRTYLFVVDDILVAVEASGGFDLDRLHTVSADDDLVPLVALAAADRLRG